MNTKINAADWVEVKKVKIDGLTFEYELRKHHPSVKIYEEVKYFRNIKTKEIVEETIEEYLKTIDREHSTVEVSFFGGTFTGIEEEKQKEFLKIAKRYKD